MTKVQKELDTVKQNSSWEILSELEKHFACDICKFHANTLPGLKTHKRDEHKWNKCDHCQGGGRGISGIKRHLESCGEIKEEKSYTCDDCDFKATFVAKLEEHVTEMHTTFDCKMCGFKILGTSHLEAHIGQDCLNAHDFKSKQTLNYDDMWKLEKWIPLKQHTNGV